MKKYFLGVDGGGTKTHCALFDGQGQRKGFVEGGPGNHEGMSDGYDGTKRVLEEAVGRLLDDAGLEIGDIGYAVFGLSGVDVKKQQHELTKRIADIGFDKFLVINDAFIGIKAGSEKGFGICSINGTGTCCAGIDPKGGHLQVGGTGYTFGDRAGACHLGPMVVRTVYDSMFRLGQPTLMKDLLFKELDLADEYDFTDVVYDRVFYSKTKSLYDFTRILFKAAGMGDAVARKLLGDTGRSLAETVLGTAARLDFSSVGELDIIMAGSVFTKGESPEMVESFKNRINEGLDRKASFTMLDVPPVAGSVLYSMEKTMGIIDAEVRKRVLASFV